MPAWPLSDSGSGSFISSRRPIGSDRIGGIGPDRSLAHEGVLRDHYIGLDYKVALDYHLYFVTFRDIVTWAIENKYHTYYSAPLNYEPKYHLRHDLVPLDLYVRTSWDWINPLFRFVVPYLEPTRYDAMIHRFANAHELW